MKRLFLFLISSVLIFSVHADKMIIPFDCYPRKIQNEFAKYGLKLDLYGEERTPDSWGFIVNEGTQFIIYTYKSATPRDFNIIMNVVQNRNDPIEEEKDE